MYNPKHFETPEHSIERDKSFLIFMIAMSLMLISVCYLTFKAFNGVIFLIIIPAIFIPYQTLWMLLNPYAKIFKDRFEIRKSYFSSKVFYFVDIAKLSENKEKRLFIQFKDGELEPLNLQGIQKGGRMELKQEIEKRLG